MAASDSGEQRTPARIDLEDFIAAVTRGVARAIEEQDVTGFVASRGQTNLSVRPQYPFPGATIGIILNPTFPTSDIRGAGEARG